MSRLVEIVKARLNLGKLFKTDKDNLMLNRPSFPASRQNSTPTGFSGDGQSGSPILTPSPLTPSPFVPNYSGDGHGKPTGDGQGTRQAEPMPIWSGDGRNDIHNPMMPTWGNTDGRFIHRRAESPVSVAVQSGPMDMQQPRTAAVPLSEELEMNVNLPSSGARPEATQSAPKTSGTWKLIALVVVFLVWVSTASTLLFLYMDRYLFP